MADVVVVGGGVIGLSVAYELAGQGATVTLLEQAQFGQEASWAGAGILHPGNLSLATSPQAKLRALSFSCWQPLSKQLKEQTGIDNCFLNCGAIQLGISTEKSLQAEYEEWQREGVEAEWLNMVSIANYEPALAPQFQYGVRLPQLHQVRNPRHLKALYRGCQQRGVQLIPGTPVVDWQVQLGRVRAAEVLTDVGRYFGDHFVITAGAWSDRLLRRANCQSAITPVRGQMVLLNMQQRPIRHVIEAGPRYVVPRNDGRVLVGSTEEWVGFDKRNTAEGIRSLLEFGSSLVPSLKDATLERCWSGLRPRSSTNIPIIDRVPDYQNLFVAAGHFRSGLQLSPATGLLVRQLLLGQPLSVPLAAFGFDAHASAPLRDVRCGKETTS